jgi:hypothetical protein
VFGSEHRLAAVVDSLNAALFGSADAPSDGSSKPSTNGGAPFIDSRH